MFLVKNNIASSNHKCYRSEDDLIIVFKFLSHILDFIPVKYHKIVPSIADKVKSLIIHSKTSEGFRAKLLDLYVVFVTKHN